MYVANEGQSKMTHIFHNIGQRITTEIWISTVELVNLSLAVLEAMMKACDKTGTI